MSKSLIQSPATELKYSPQLQQQQAPSTPMAPSSTAQLRMVTSTSALAAANGGSQMVGARARVTSSSSTAAALAAGSPTNAAARTRLPMPSAASASGSKTPNRSRIPRSVTGSREHSPARSHQAAGPALVPVPLSPHSPHSSQPNYVHSNTVTGAIGEGGFTPSMEQWLLQQQSLALQGIDASDALSDAGSLASEQSMRSYRGSEVPLQLLL